MANINSSLMVADREEFQYYQPLIICPSVGAQKAMPSPSNAADDRQEESTSREEESSRGKLFKHCNDVAGRVCIPEKWGQEALLKDWIDSSLFDALLGPKGVVSARDALVAEQKRDRTRQLIKDGMYVLS